MSEEQRDNIDGLYFNPSLIRKLILDSQNQQQQSKSNNNNKNEDNNNKGNTTTKNQQQHNNKQKQRMTNEAVQCVNELLYIFVKEARHRASIEAECEHEAFDIDDTFLIDHEQQQDNNSSVKKKALHTDSDDDDDDCVNASTKSLNRNQSNKKRYNTATIDIDSDSSCIDETSPKIPFHDKKKKQKKHEGMKENCSIVTIRADHVTKIAAELIMDFS